MQKHLVLLVISVVFLSGSIYADKVDDLIGQLKGSDTAAASKAAEMLGKSKDKRAVKPLLDIAASGVSTPDEIRVAAINALSSYSNSTVIKAMLEVVKDAANSDQVRQAAGRIVGKRPNRVITRMFEAELMSGDNVRQVEALKTLGFIGNDNAVYLIAPAMNDRHLRKEAAAALGKTGNPKASQILLRAMDNAFIRDEVFEALTNSNDPTIFKPLAEMMLSTRIRGNIRIKILDYVINSGHKDSLGYIKRAMSDRSFAKDAAPVLLKSDNPNLKALASEAIASGNASSMDTRKAVSKLLESPKPEDLEIIGSTLASGRMRNDDERKAVDYLIRSKDPKAITYLGQALTTGKMWHDEQSKIIAYLISSNKPEVITPLGEALTKCRLRNDEQSKILECLYKFDKPETLPYLGKALSRSRLNSSMGREVISRLADSGEPLYAEYLGSSVMDSYNHSYAVKALLKIGGPSIAKPIAPAIVLGDKQTRDKVYDILMAVEEAWLMPEIIGMLKHESKAKKSSSWNSTSIPSRTSRTISSSRSSRPDRFGRPSRTSGLERTGLSSRSNRPSLSSRLDSISSTDSSKKLSMSKMSKDHFVQLNDLFLKKVKPEHVDAFVETLKSLQEQEFAVELLTKLNWQPKTPEDKLNFYFASRQWDKCKPFGEPAANLMLDYIKRTAEAGPIATLVQMGASQHAKAILLEKLEKWSIRNEQAQALKSRLGWTAKSVNDNVNYAIGMSDLNQLKKIWDKNSQVTSYFINRLNNGYAYRVIRISIDLKRKDMVGTLTSYLNRMGETDSMAETTVNAYLNSGNKQLHDTAEAWVKKNGGTIREIGFGVGTQQW